MLLIEPLSQSDRAGSQLLLFRLIGTQSRVSLFVARQAVRRKERAMCTKLAFSIVPTNRNLSELQKRDDSNASHADLSRRRF